MSNGLALPNGISQEQQRRAIIQQNFAVLSAQVFTALAAEDYREAVRELKARQDEAAVRGLERPTNLIINPSGAADVALAYASHFALERLPAALGQT
jgi:hypothetical protein